MTSTSTSLYQRLGGEGAVRAVVDRFYEMVLVDPVLRPYFAGVDLRSLRRHQALFLSQVAGGPTEYDGREMAAAHAGLGVNDEAFDRVAGHLVEALREFEVGEPEIAEVVQAVTGLRPSIVEPAR